MFSYQIKCGNTIIIVKADTRSEKIANLKSLKAQDSFVRQLDYECLTQYPQPNGDIYLHGQTITIRRYNEAIIDYNNEAKLRNSYTKENWPLRQTVTFLKTRKRVA